MIINDELVKSKKLTPYCSFSRRCKNCEEVKHIQKFKRNKKMYQICNECVSKNKVTCIKCNLVKSRYCFLGDSKVYLTCHECRDKSVLEIKNNFDVAFNALTNISKEKELENRD